MNMLPVGTRFCQCAACGAYFGGVSAFEAHRVGEHTDRGCLALADMPAAGLSLNAKGYWVRAYGDGSGEIVANRPDPTGQA